MANNHQRTKKYYIHQAPLSHTWDEFKGMGEIIAGMVSMLCWKGEGQLAEF